MEKVELKNIWKEFIESPDPAGKTWPGLNKKTLNSWLECRDWNLDPIKDGFCNLILPPEELNERYRKWQNKYDIIAGFMENLFEFTRGTKFLISMADREGYILKIIGDQDVMGKFAGFNYVPGAYWRLREVGTNSVDLALKYEEPIQVLGAEHYCRNLQAWACSAAPIFDENQELFAVINISGYTQAAHKHTLGMVVTAAKAIETLLRLNKTTFHLQETSKVQQAIVDSISEGLILIDKQGIIKFMNKAGGEILQVNHEKAVNLHVTEIVDFRPVILDVLKKQEGYVDKEFFIRSRGEMLHFIKTAVVLKNDKGEMTGVLDSFREISRVRKLVNKMTGAQASFTFNDIIGESQALKGSKEMAEIAANSVSNVLLQGESGTGKEIFAQAIHNASARADGPFIALNCAAIPLELIESELFGYVEGAFTGAKRGGRPGKFELASGGTILLDEIGEMPLNMQVKLLRVLQDRKVNRIGGEGVIPVNIRVIASSNKDLKKEVQDGHFREDLYYRLNVLNISIPPLRERNGDIVILASYFLKKINLRLGKNIEGFDQPTLQALLNYPWPGNVRELENVIERMVNITEEKIIFRSCLNRIFPVKGEESIESNSSGEIRPLEEIEKEQILKAITSLNGNITKAAEALRISRATIYNKLRGELSNF